MSDRSECPSLASAGRLAVELTGVLVGRLNGDWELSFITTLYIDELYPRLGACGLLLARPSHH